MLIVHLYKMHTRNAMERDLSQMKVNFLTDISHKLRTPLTLIGGPIKEVLNTEKLGPQARHQLEMVHRNAEQMLALVNKMITINTDKITFISDDSIPERAAEEGSSVSGEPTADEPTGKDKTRLLIVEDNNDLLDFLSGILSADYTISQASNGEEGLEKARKEVPDFILTDVMMPKMDGLEMVRQIKANPETSHIPIIILSAKASMDDRMAGLRAGENDYNAVCLGRTTFFLKLKSLVGMSPVEFLRHIRIQHAEELVAKTSDSFSQIAYAVGFNDSRYFGKCFKKQTGMTPSEYRERRKAAEEGK